MRNKRDTQRKISQIILIVGDMTLYLKDPKDSASRLLDLTITFNILGYTLTYKKWVVFFLKIIYVYMCVLT